MDGWMDLSKSIKRNRCFHRNRIIPWELPVYHLRCYTWLLLCFYDRLRHQQSSYLHDLAVIYSRRWDNVSPHVLIPQLLIPVNGSHTWQLCSPLVYSRSHFSILSVYLPLPWFPMSLNDTDRLLMNQQS